MTLSQTKLIADIKIYAHSLCRSTVEADRLVKDASETVVEFSPVQHSDIQMRNILFSLMRKQYYGSIVAPENRMLDEEVPVSVVHEAFSCSTEAEKQKIAFTVRNLPAHFREAIVLMAIVGDDTEQAATIMECSVDTVNDRFETAQCSLQAHLFQMR